MKTLVLALSAAVLLAFGASVGAQPLTGFGPPPAFGGPSWAPGFPIYQSFPCPGFIYFPSPLPPAPSLGFGRGGIYGHQFFGRSETITGYTFPGRR